MEIIDVTPPIRDGMSVYPGNPPVRVEQVRSVAEGAHSTLSQVTMGTHAGLHVDAPAHFIAGAASLEAMPLEALVGIVRVIDVWSEHTIEVAHLEPLEILPGERVLFKTRNSELWAQDEFVEDYVYFSTEAARYLAARRPACVGIDYLSVGGFHLNGTEVHEALLGVGILLIEGLDLRAVEPGAWTLVCLPLRLAETEAAPARAILMR